MKILRIFILYRVCEGRTLRYHACALAKELGFDLKATGTTDNV